MSVDTHVAIRWVFPVGLGLATPLTRASVIGRAEENGTCLDASEVSRRHAEVFLHRGVAHLRDLQSRNGSHVNGCRIDEAELELGDVVRLGQCVGLVSRVSEPDPGCREIARGLVGGRALTDALADARRIAESELSVVIVGETGTGKELVARAIHDWSGRRGDFIAVNCATLPEQLADGLLFGYARGAFTGADRERLGHFREADRGTLLLDEVVDLSASVQPKLLRALQEGEVLQLGTSKPTKISVRVIATAQEPLQGPVDRGEFRADLLARLEGAAISLPPLRERKDDIAYIFDWMLAHHAAGEPPRVAAQLVEQLCLYDWPGNVRELTQVAKNVLAVHGHEALIERRHLPPRMLSAGATHGGVPPAPAPEGTRDENELNALLTALRAHGGNVKRAAATVGISKARAYRLMGAANVDPDAYRDATRR